MEGLISVENISVRPIHEEILALNEVSSQYGLLLSDEEAKELSNTRNTALSENERVEIGTGAVEKIIKKFCKSRYIDNDHYAYILNEVTYLFYYIKSETDDRISDDDLLNELFERFELYSHGDIDTLLGREAERIIRKVNSGEHYYEWYRERDELDSNSVQGSREAPVEYEETGDGARKATVSSYDEEFFTDEENADHDMYEDDLDWNDEDDAIDYDSFDAIMDMKAVERSYDAQISVKDDENGDSDSDDSETQLYGDDEDDEDIFDSGFYDDSEGECEDDECHTSGGGHHHGTH